jgi:ATP-dependent protease ClpP protease subunit
MSWYRVTAHADVVVAAITGPIESDTAAQFLRALGSAQHVRVTIASPGGDAAGGLMIAGALRGRRRVEVDAAGLVASAATLPLCAGHTVRASADAVFMLHGPRLASDAPKGSDGPAELARIRQAMIATYQWRVRRSAAEIDVMLDRTTWLTADEARALGLVDVVSPALKVAARFDPVVLAPLGAVPPRLRPTLARLVTRPLSSTLPIERADVCTSSCMNARAGETACAETCAAREIIGARGSWTAALRRTGALREPFATSRGDRR